MPRLDSRMADLGLGQRTTSARSGLLDLTTQTSGVIAAILMLMLEIQDLHFPFIIHTKNAAITRYYYSLPVAGTDVRNRLEKRYFTR
jgi:hypothetical protein